MSEARRQQRRRKRTIRKGGFITKVAEAHPVVIRGTGDLYLNTQDGKYYVSINGEWVCCPLGKWQAVRKMERHFKIKKCDRAR